MTKDYGDWYHRVTRDDCLEVATKHEANRLGGIHDTKLLTSLALRWCTKHGYKLGAYIGHMSWDATKVRVE